MNEDLLQSYSYNINQWKKEKKNNKQSRQESIPLPSTNQVKICCGVKFNCRLDYDIEKNQYIPQKGCKRGSFCTEFRIFKNKSTSFRNLRSSYDLMTNYDVFKEL